MSFNQEKGFCFCERCGHDWIAKPVDNEIKQPSSCAKCKSKVWNQPRVYSGKYISGTLAKRFKPTGRAASAARRKIDPQLAEWNEIAADPEKTKSEKLDAILNTLSPEERGAAVKQIVIWELATMLEEMGLK